MNENIEDAVQILLLQQYEMVHERMLEKCRRDKSITNT